MPCSRRIHALLAALFLVCVGVLTGCASQPKPVTTVIVNGDFGQKPTLTIPAIDPPTTLRTTVVHEGSGPVISQGQTITANYLGQRWKPMNGQTAVFDNSFDRHQPITFRVGVGEVIPGWDQALIGHKVGSRVLLEIPPDLAYGPDPLAHELGGQTLVFVVDLISAA